MGIKVGIVGTGSFSQCFIPLFKVHPLVDNIVLCDLNKEKLEQNALKHQIKETSASLDELIQSDVDAVVIMTQNWLHAPQAIKALNSGKHVYSAVPAGISVNEIEELVKTVENTGNIYMIGETSYYHPEVIYCRNQFAKGEFGHIIYAEGQYFHDRGDYGTAKSRAGDKWREVAGDPPLYYPTHTISMLVSVTGAYPTHVSALGYKEQDDIDIYNKDINRYGNEFSCETALFKMSDGSVFRINEFRKVGSPPNLRFSIYGTKGSFEESESGSVWMSAKSQESISELLKCSEEKNNGETYRGLSKVHDWAQLPKEFIGLNNGHRGSHYFLVDEFVMACITGKIPPNNVWMAARYNIPGLIAHESAKLDGKQLEILDLGMK